MKEKLDQFERKQVWNLVKQIKNFSVIKTIWVYRNKMTEKKKSYQKQARLVAQGYSQQKGSDYDETFSLVARLESICIILAYSLFKYFK